MDQPTESGAELTVNDAAERITNLLGSDEPEEVEEPTESEEVDSEEEGEVSDDQEAESEPESPQFQSVDELAEAVGMDVDTFLKQIKGKIKIDGEESEVSLDELRNGYQREADYRRKTMDLAERRKEFESVAEIASKQLMTQHHELAAMLNYSEQQLRNEYQSIDWQDLRATDPGEYSARLAEFQQRQAQLAGMRQNASQHYQRLTQEQERKKQQIQAEMLQKESSALLDKLPSWKDESVASKERKEIVDFLKTEYGFSPEDINGVTDHRFVLLAKDAMSKREQVTAKELAKKKVENLPKVLKPGVKQSKVEAKSQAQKKQLEKAKRSGSMDDLASLFASKI